MNNENFIKILEKTEKIYEPEDFNEFLRNDMFDKNIHPYYQDLLNSSMIKRISNFEELFDKDVQKLI